MFQRAVRLREAEEALARGLWEEALRLASDPLVASHRRAREVRRKARQALLERARHRMERGNLPGARRDLARAGGDATLAEDLREAFRLVRQRDREEELLWEKVRFFLEAGLPRKARDLLAGLPQGPRREESSRLVEEALSQALRLEEDVGRLLAEGRRGDAISAWRNLMAVDRESALARDRAAALFPSSGSDPAGGLTAAAREEGGILEAPSLRPLLEARAALLLEEAGRALRKGDRRRADSLLEALEGLPLGEEGWDGFLRLRERLRRDRLGEEGRAAEAAGVSAGPDGDLPEEGLRAVEDTARRIEEFLGEGRLRPEPLLPREGSAWFGREVPADLEEARQASQAALEEGLSLLERSDPRPALRAFLEVRTGSPQRGRGIREALERIGRARLLLGAWTSLLARLGGPGTSPEEGRRLLEEAARADRRAPGLEPARTQGEEASAFLRLLEELREAETLEEGAGLLLRSRRLPPRGALTLRRLGREGLLRLCRTALEEGCRRETARLLGEARELWGLPPDRAFPPPKACGKAGIPAPPRSDPRGGFFLRVAGRGDVLVLPADRLILGSAAGKDADLPVLAKLGSREAEFLRTLSFHEGLSFRVRSLSGRPFLAGGEEKEDHLLGMEEELRFGSALKVRFRRPGPESATALLDFGGDFDVRGCRWAAWMKHPGRDGALVVGPGEDAHLRLPGIGVRLEIALDPEGRFLLRSTENIRAEGRDLGREGLMEGFGRLETGRLLLFLDPGPQGDLRESSGSGGRGAAGSSE